MKTITKFQAVDGKEFTDKQECLKYEELIIEVDIIMSVLPETPKNDACNFSNGGGFLQHKKRVLRTSKIEILELCKKYIDHHWIQQTIDDCTVDPSWVARLLSDYNIQPLNNAWYRFSCIDKQSREWGQPYYANNPNEGEQISLSN